MLHKIKIK